MEENIPWTRKYMPKRLSDVVGQDKPLKALKEFVLNFKKQKKKAVLIYGPAGCGKTSSVYALARELGYDIIEINASDVRNKEQIEKTVGQASMQLTLFGKGKIILIDEIDGLAGTKDKGGVQAIQEIIDKTSYPIVMTAINPYDNKFSNLRKKVEMIEYNALNYLSVAKVLEKICKLEGVKYDRDALLTLARRAGSDLRGAIIDLQTLATKKYFTIEELDILGERKKTETIIEALKRIFKTTNPLVALTAPEIIEEDLDQLFLWIDENLPREYKKNKDLAKAYFWLSKADIFRARIIRWQYYRFNVYTSALLTTGIALAKEEKYSGFTAYKPTQRILKLWIAKQRYEKRNSIASKIAEKIHSSKKYVIFNVLPYFRYVFEHKKGKELADYFDLTKDEISWLSRE